MNAIRPEAVEKLLVRGTNWVGDSVMSVPAMKEIRRLFPQARITLMVRPWVREVFSAADFIDDVFVYDKAGRHRGWRGLRAAASELRREKFDLAILLQNAFEAAAVAWLAGIPQRVGYARDARSMLLTHACAIEPAVRRAHQTYYYLDLLSAAGLLPGRLWETEDYRPSIALEVRDEDVRAARELLRRHGVDDHEKLIGVNPGATYGWAKRWLSDRYAAVADRLAAGYAARIVLFGSPGERAIAEEIAGYMRARPVVLAGTTTLGELMGLIRSCRLLITNDSGPMHLAAALDVPQVAIFGSTSVEATGPLSPAAEVVRHPVECSPCFLRECPIDFRCMKRVTEEDVMEAARRSMER